MKNSIKKITCWLSFLVLAFFISIPGYAQVRVDYPGQERDLKIAKELVSAYESGNWETLRELTAQDVTFYNLGTYDSLNIDKTINYWKEGRKAATPVLSEEGTWLAVEVPEGRREGKWVLHWGENTLTYPNGETISFPYHVALKYDGDKVDEVHFYYDNNRIVRALGYEIQPPLTDDDESDQNEDF